MGQLDLTTGAGEVFSVKAGPLVEGAKFDTGKTRLDLLSPVFLEQTAEVLGFGADKYEAHNWAKGIAYSRVFAALLRHLWAWWRGERLDPESGLTHLAHASCCLMFLVHYEHYTRQGDNHDGYKMFDDRWLSS